MYRKFISFVLKRIKKGKDARVKFLSLELIKELECYRDKSSGVGSIDIFFDYDHIENRTGHIDCGQYTLKFETKQKNIHFKNINHE